MPTGLEALLQQPLTGTQQGAGAYGTHRGAPILNAQVLDRLGGTFGNVHQDLGLGWGTLEGSPDVIGVRSGAELLGARRGMRGGAEGSEETPWFEGLEAAAQRLGIDTSPFMKAQYTTGEGGAQEQVGSELDRQALWDAIGKDPSLAGKYLVTGNRYGWGDADGLAADAPQEHQYAQVMYQRVGDRLVPVAAPRTFEYNQQSVLQEALPVLGMLAVPFGGIGGLVGKGMEAAGLGNVLSGASSGLASLIPEALQPAVAPALRGAIGGGLGAAVAGGDIGTGLLSGGLGGAASGLVGSTDFVRGMESPMARDFVTSMAGNVASQIPFGGMDFRTAFTSSALGAGTRAALSGARQSLIDSGFSPQAASRVISMTASLAPNLLFQRDITPQQIISMASRVATER